jgi:electron transfer flavoprotein beta subunit
MRGIMTARTKPLKVVEPVQENKASEVSTYSMPEGKKGVKMIPTEEAATLIDLLRNEAKVL